MSKHFIPAVLLSIAALTAPTHAQTYQFGDANVRSVSVRDLDLTNAKDVALLDRRINTAVKQVCSPIDSVNPITLRIVRKCRRDTLARVQIKRDAKVAAAQNRRAAQVASITAR